MNSNLPISTELIESAIAVVGMALRFPGADREETFWRNLLEGTESISSFSDAELTSAGVDPAVFQKPNYVRARGIVSDVHGFDAFFFGFNPNEAEIMDVQHRIFLECAWEALESAGYDPNVYPGLIGVYAGANMSTYFLRHLFPRLHALGTAAGYQSVISNEKDFLPSLTSYKLNLRGPSVCIQSACSTSLVAVHSACQSLLNGECDMALAGGVSVETPQETGYSYEEEMILSPDGHCRPFDADGQGTVGGNGCGIVLLKRLEDALAERDSVRAIIRGTAVNNDGALKVGFTAPGITGQTSVIAEALGVARVDPESIGYVEAHGTGTALGDPVEIEALRQAFATDQRRYCALGAVKSNLGHLGPAAGIAGLIKAVLSIEHGRIPPTLHFKNPNPKINLADSPFFVNAEPIDWPAVAGPRRAGVSSFGIGGTNAHAILEEAPAIPKSGPAVPDRPYQLWVLSAKTESAVDRSVRNLAARFRSDPSIDLGDAAFTLQAGRRRFGHRRALVCRNIEDAIQVLETPGSNRLLTGQDSFDGSAVVFMFSGQGSQYIHMGRDTCHTEPVFRDTVDRCVEILQPLLNMDLRAVIYPDPSTEEKAAIELDRTELTQPALFVLEYALARLWMSWGIHPAAMIGHSIGEYVAACLAGVFSLEDALHLVAERGRLMGSLPAGSMTAVFRSESEIIDIIQKEGDSRLSLAAVNSPSLCTVSGPNQEIEGLEERLQTFGVAFRRLHTSHAFHSGMMDPILDAFAEKAACMSLHAPNIAFVSNLTGDWIQNSEAVSPDYWTKHLRGTVRFADGIQTVSADPNKILLEIGPGSTLAGLAREIRADDRGGPVLSSLPHPRETVPDYRFLLSTLGNLWLCGTEVDWNQFHTGSRQKRRIPLPTYPFEHRSYCFGSPAAPLDETAPANREDGKNPEIDHWFYIPSWKRTHPVRSGPEKPVEDKTHWIILMDESGLGRRISNRLRTDGHPVIAVTRGAAFSQTGEASFTVNPAMPRDFQALLKALRKDDHPSFKVLHLWSLTGAMADADPSPDAGLRDMLNRGTFSLLFLTQAIAKSGGTGEMIVIADGLQEVTGNEAIHPGKTALLGLATVISQEHSSLRCRSIDIEVLETGHPRPAELPDRLIDRLMMEISTNTAEPETAYRGQFRWVRCFEPFPVKTPAALPPLLRKQGVYWITGGLGEIGLILARHLARTVQARLVLSGRSEIPERGTWRDRTAGQDPEDSVKRRIRAIQEIESLGGAVLVCRADAADETAMQKVLTRALDQFGQLNGVIHAAGRTGIQAMRSVEETDHAVCEAHFGPKIHGVCVLERVLGDLPLDFCILMSSLSSVLGGLGFGAYAAANRFMDAFAVLKSGKTAVPWISVDWDGWQTTKSKEAETALGTSVAELAIEPAEGTRAFDRVLSLSDTPQVLVSTGDLDSRLNRWLQPQTSESRAVTEEKKVRHPRPDLSVAYQAPRSDPERTLAGIFEELLGIDAVGIHDNFFDLGGHSLLATQAASRIQEIFQVRLPLQRMFEAPTVAGLSDALAQHRLEQGKAEDMDKLLEDLEGMSEEEALKLLSALENKED
jgi:acyl transferase domain-containing protein